ncbi:MAG: hypothetical protein HC877_15470 [Thioploca sp.]|nr:hypothetical protein [Thioploca sp.]
MWNKLLKRRLALISAMIILLPLAAIADGIQLTEIELIQLIKQSASVDGIQLTEKELEDLVEKLINPPPDPPFFKPCWGSSVESYHPGNPAPWPQFANPLKILGEPNANDIDHTQSVSLGNTLNINGPYGEITVSFGEQFTARPEGELYLYEVGTDNESVYLQVRRADTDTYYPADPGLLVPTDYPFTIINLSQFGISNNVKLDAIRIRDAVGGNIGAAAAGADIDATGIDCDSFLAAVQDQPPLSVEILAIEANRIEEGVAILWKTGVMTNVAKMHLMRVPVKMNGQLDKAKAVLISEKNFYPTQNYGALDNKLPPPGQYAYVIKEITTAGEQTWHDDNNQGEIAIIEIQ